MRTLATQLFPDGEGIEAKRYKKTFRSPFSDYIVLHFQVALLSTEIISHLTKELERRSIQNFE